MGEQFVVVTLGAEGQNQHHEVTVSDFEDKSGSSAVSGKRQSYQISSTATLGQIRVQGACNGQGFTAQVERGGARTRWPCAFSTTARRSKPWCSPPARACTG